MKARSGICNCGLAMAVHFSVKGKRLSCVDALRRSIMLEPPELERDPPKAPPLPLGNRTRRLRR